MAGLMASPGVERLLVPLQKLGVYVTGDKLLVVPRNAGLTSADFDRIDRLCANGYDWKYAEDAA